MHITRLLILFSTHLDIVVFANNDVTVHFLNDSLFHSRYFCRLLLLFAQIFDILVIVFSTVLVSYSLLSLHFWRVLSFSNHLSLLFDDSPILVSSMRSLCTTRISQAKARSRWTLTLAWSSTIIEHGWYRLSSIYVAIIALIHRSYASPPPIGHFITLTAFISSQNVADATTRSTTCLITSFHQVSHASSSGKLLLATCWITGWE